MECRPENEFIKLLNLAVKNCHFIFNGKFYDQVDGVAMGSPLGPLLANIFLSFHEIRWLKDCPVHFKPPVEHTPQRVLPTFLN